MALPEDIRRGVEIRNKLFGSTFEELKFLRKSIWATYVISKPNEFSQEQVDEAIKIKEDMLKLNDLLEEDY